MTVAVQALPITYNGNGTASPLAVPFRFLANDHLVVTRIDAAGARTVLLRGTDYTVSGADTGSGGSVTPLTAIAVGDKWEIDRFTPREQPTAYPPGDDFPAATHEKALDRNMLVAQEIDKAAAAISARTPKVPAGEIAPDFASLSEYNEGDRLEIREGKLRRVDSSALAGKFYAGAAVTGNPVPSDGLGGADDAFRGDAAGDAGMQLLAGKRTSTAFRRQQAQVNRDAAPHLFDYTPGALHAAILAKTSTQDITEFLNNARVAAIAEKYDVVQLPPGQAVISDTIDLQDTAGFLGMGFKGPGKDNLILLQALSADDAEKPLFRMLGGSGTHTNKVLSGLTIRPADASYDGRGKMLQVKEQNFAHCFDLVGERLHTFIELVNENPASFTEKNSFHSIRALDCHRGIAMIVNDDGDSSFHGNSFFGVCQINIPENGYGLFLQGNANPAYYYNAEANFRMFSGSGTRTAIYCENAITQNLELNISCEDDCSIEIVDSGSRFHSRGRFRSTHAINFDCVEDGQLLFENLRNGSNFAASSLSALAPQPLSSAIADRNTAGDFPTVFKMVATGVEALALAAFDGGGANGIYMGKIPFEGRLEDFVAQAMFDGLGGLRFLNGNGDAGIIAGRLSIASAATASLARPVKGAIVVVRDNAIGGIGVYRADETGAVALISGDAQFVTAVASDKIGLAAAVGNTTISNGFGATRSVDYLAIGMLG